MARIKSFGRKRPLFQYDNFVGAANTALSGRAVQSSSAYTWLQSIAAGGHTWNIASPNQAQSDGGNNTFSTLTADFGLSDYIAEISNITAQSGAGIAGRTTDKDNCWYVSMSGNTAAQPGLHKRVAGVDTLLSGVNVVQGLYTPWRFIQVGPLSIIRQFGQDTAVHVDGTAFQRTATRAGICSQYYQEKLADFKIYKPHFSVIEADSFNRADNASLGSCDYKSTPWQVLAGAGAISGNKASLSGAGTNLVVADIGSADGTFGNKLSTGTTAGLAFRVQDANNYLKLVYTFGNTQVQLFKVVNGVATALTGNFRCADAGGNYNYPTVVCKGQRITIKNVSGRGTSFRLNLFTTATKHGLFSTGAATFSNFFATSETSQADVIDDAPSIIFDGNSLTEGVNGDGTPVNYPMQVMKGLPDSYDFINQGSNGAPTSTLITTAPSNVDIYYDATRRANIVVFWEGTNDLTGTQNAATAWANIQTYCNARRAAGYKVILLSILPRGGGVYAAFETDRQTTNTSMRNGWTSIADAFCDVGADALIGQAGQNTNTAYYAADGIHMKNAGYDIIAKYVKDALFKLGVS